MNMTDDTRKALALAWQLMRYSAAKYRERWLKDRSNTAAFNTYFTYDNCASILAEALDGRWDRLEQRTDGNWDQLPALPENMRWADWDDEIRL